jgi:hypothetical protein
MGDMNKRRGRIIGIDTDEDGSAVSCEVCRHPRWLPMPPTLSR